MLKVTKNYTTWIKDFLFGRAQCVRIGTCLSSDCAVISGVPQGSVLGPVLFILFVNDTVACSHGCVTVKMFADDTKLYTTITDKSSAAMLQTSLDYILKWSTVP